MKTLYESLLDDFDTLAAPLGVKNIKEQIKEFLKQNYQNPSYAKISRKPNEDGLYVVDWKRDLVVMNRKIEQLTNDLFTFGEVNGSFSCECCGKLKTLKGAPQIVYGNFDCSYCKALESFKGGPQIVEGTFDFTLCSSITSLEGAPKQCEAVESWNTYNNITLKSFEGCPQAQKIRFEDIKGVKNLKGLPQKGVHELYLENLPDLESFEGGPTEIGWQYQCYNCEKLKSFKGSPSTVPYKFACSHCHSLKNFEGAPKEVGFIYVCHNKMLDGNHPEVLKGFPKKARTVSIYVSDQEQEKLGVKLEPFTVEQICAVCDVDPKNVSVAAPL